MIEESVHSEKSTNRQPFLKCSMDIDGATGKIEAALDESKRPMNRRFPEFSRSRPSEYLAQDIDRCLRETCNVTRQNL
jgi:hypothetical protein